MAGIEDFVVEQIIQDMRNIEPTIPQASMENQNSIVGGARPITTPTANTPTNTAAAQPQHSFRVHGVDFTPGQFENYLQTPLPNQQFLEPHQRVTYGQQATADYGQQQKEQVLALNKRDAARATIMEGLKGLDPAVQAQVMKRLGIDVGAVKSRLEQEKELATFKQGLETPQLEAANQLKAIGLAQTGQHQASELALNRQKAEADVAGRADTRNIQVMRVLAMMMQSDASGRLAQQLGPALMQMMQSAGVNLAPPAKATTSKPASGAGFKITRE